MATRVQGLCLAVGVLALLAAVACDPHAGPAAGERAATRPGSSASPGDQRITGGDCAGQLSEADAVELRRGAEVWDILCTSCHGAAGQGGSSSRLQGIQPPDLTDPARAASFAPGERMRIIAGGVPGTTMVGWQHVLTEREVVAVYRHVCSLMQERPAGAPG